MMRWHKAPEILAAAQRWRDQCLQADGSILSGKPLWTVENLGHLDRYFVQNLDEGEGSFFEKLKAQLHNAPPSAKQLAAEILWILYLCVSETAIRGGTKRLQIRRVWEWSGEDLPDEASELGPILEQGVASPGPGFHNHKWREFAFAIELARDWKRLVNHERQRIIGDPWAFAEWVDAVDASAGRQFRHMLLYLLFPEHFERVVTNDHKKRIIRTFFPRFGRNSDTVDFNSRTAIDRALYELRPDLERKYGSEQFDFYLEPFRSEWLETNAHSTGSEANTPAIDYDAWYAEKFGDARVWVIAAGEGARLWTDFQNESIVAIGWDYLDDLTAYPSRDAIREAIQKKEGGNPTNNSLACWQFVNEMKPGDSVVVKQGRSIVLGHGIIDSDYRYDDNRTEYQNVRAVNWRQLGRWTLPKQNWITTKTLTEFTLYKDWLYRAFSLMEGATDTAETAPTPDNVEYTLTDALNELFMPPEKLSAVLDALARKKNIILEGAPGVGKTFVARRIAWAMIGRRDPARVQMVQFHQSYAYEDFVQGWRPNGSGGFELKDGIFYRFCRKARGDPNNRYVFIIDEINRGNLSKVLGELMMLVESDKRGPDYGIPLTYSTASEDRFYVPDNVFILGLMNTADRSLAMVDYALRRRFAFIRLKPAFGSEEFANYLVQESVPEALVKQIVDRMTELNRVITDDNKNLGPGFEIGHSFFVPGAEEEGRDEGWYERVVRQEIEPLLHEYWFDQPQRVEDQVARLLA